MSVNERKAVSLNENVRRVLEEVENFASVATLSPGVSIFDLENPYYSVEIRGVAELIEDRETALPVKLCRSTSARIRSPNRESCV